MASTTKMMTAIVAVRYGDLDAQVLIDESDIVGEASMGLIAGTTISLHGLLYGLLLPSGNDAAHAIARSIGESRGATTPEAAVQNFVDLMNQTAQEYQLRDTHYMNPHGLDEWGHYSTAFDLAIILRAALNYPVIRDVMQTPAINVDGYDVQFGCSYDTLLVLAKDRPGTINQVTGWLARHKINIAFLRVKRDKRGGDSIMIIETDATVDPMLLEAFEDYTWVRWVRQVPKVEM